ncbi:MAG: energy-coupling factor ABC transporter permease [Proteobacteria bacterium]|nr:energy-coupling factor ABC transporter permease [Pseudomonadota bacterium]
MHLPDGFLSPPVWGALGLVAVATLGVCVVRVRRDMPEDMVPRMGMLGAFVFAAQMVNIPVAAGTSGHLLGGVLVASLLGAEAATLVMASVFVIQCLLFQDGGMLAMGANIVNMGLTGTIGGFLLMCAALRVVKPRYRDLAVFGAAWFTVVATSALVSLELTASGVVPLVPSLVAMVSIHAVIGLIEGAVTVGVIRFLERVRPEVLDDTPLAVGAS